MQKVARLRFQIAVCDSSCTDRQETARMAQEILAGEDIACEISSYEQASALLGAIQGGKSFHLLLLEPVMDGMGGVELAAALRGQGDDTPVVFISADREMALRGYEVGTLRYLEKPVDSEKLREALLAGYRVRLAKREILLPGPNGQTRVSPADLVYAETALRSVLLVFQNSQWESSVKISRLAAMLPARDFVFCHRTILVNLAYVRMLRHCELELLNGKKLPVSKYRQTELREKLERYLERRSNGLA